jgi:hypothetical protein
MPPGGAPYGMPPQKTTSGAAIASLIFGILGCVPFITGLLAIILGIVGIKKTGDPRYSGRGLAIGGLLLGLLSLVLWGVFGGGLYAYYVVATPARQLSHQFARDLAAGNIDAAQGSSTGAIGRDELATASEKMKSWGTLQDTTVFPVMEKSGGVDAFEGAGFINFSNGQPVQYFVRMVKTGGQLKVDGFSLQHGTETVSGGTSPKTQNRARPSSRPTTVPAPE